MEVVYLPRRLVLGSHGLLKRMFRLDGARERCLVVDEQRLRVGVSRNG